MRALLRFALALAAIVGIVAGLIYVLSDPEIGRVEAVRAVPARSRDVTGASLDRSDPKVPLFSQNFVDDSGYGVAFNYSAPVLDRTDLSLCLRGAEGRGARGIAEVVAMLDRLAAASPAPADLPLRQFMLRMYIALLHMYDARFEEADAWLAKALAEGETHRAIVPRELRSNLKALRGVAALRRGELDNCVACLGPSSCLFPLAPEAVHQRVEGSRAAVGHFIEYLRERPDDLGVRWLLNIAYMTLGEYPDRVPREYLIPLESLRVGDARGVGRFENIGASLGLESRGPNMLGGAAFDDFNGDGRPDVMVISGDGDLGGSLFVNQGEGRFEDQGRQAGLAEVKMSVNLTHADFDNDGDLDVLALRGGWETPYPLTLLRNRGDGVFDDVARTAGLGEPIATQAAAWADFDRDGLLDVYVAGEYHDRNATPANHGRLYRNRGDGTFENVAARAGVENARWAKGVAWGDHDNDGDPDLYVSNMNEPNRLYRNNGDGTFVDVAPELRLTEPISSFSCWFWDHDNDGFLDLFVAGFNASLQDLVADALGKPAEGERPRLFRNLGPDGFRDVTREVGLDRVLLPMGSNIGDIDNDGYLDVYLATGRPPYSILTPNVLFHNEGGRHFSDVTTATGTGHLQKGHGVAFADMEGDGDLDLFVQIGGQTPGDKAHNALFRNPGVSGSHWLSVRLVGRRSNRSAIGAKVIAEVVDPDGMTRTIHRVVGQGSSFGGNSLNVWLGLGRCDGVKTMTITWPIDGSVQVLKDLPADRAIVIVEGDETPRVTAR